VSPAPTRARRRRRKPVLRVLALLLAAAAIFVLGVGVGQALRDGPAPPAEVTYERTLEPLELPPAVETVTVTATEQG
jgi:ferric-dicitrate binding protein FerR (iron transport regulator)